MSRSRMDLDSLCDAKEKIYVRNNALKAGLLLVINLRDKTGMNRALKVPPVQWPICVSDQYSHEVIRESSDFRNSLSNQTIVLVPKDQAEKELQSREAQEDLKSFSMSVYSDSAPANAVRDRMENLRETPPIKNQTEVMKQSLTDAKVSFKVQGVIASFKSKEKNSKDTLIALRRLKPQLVEADLTFIINQCAGETNLREFAEQSLAELSATPEQPFEPSQS